MTKLSQNLQPALMALLRKHDIELVYTYTNVNKDNTNESLTIVVSGIFGLNILEDLEKWGHFVICPHGATTLELFTGLPDEIEKCII